VSEPYDLDDAAIQRLAALIDAGYTIRIQGWSTHFPGRTFRITVEKKESVQKGSQAR
jgi:hypothetical protein